MFKDLLFIDKTLKTVFNMKSAIEHTFSGSLEYPNITNEDYKKFNDYLLLNKDFNLKVLIGGLNLLAYGHIENKNTIVNFIKKNSEKIFNDIDNTIPNLDKIFNSCAKQYYENIINKDFSYNLLKNLDIPHYPKSEKVHYYGLEYLLLFLVQNCYEDFEKWYFKSSRVDLKIFFANLILNPYYLGYIRNENFICSKISWLKTYYILYQYNISRFISIGEKSINDVVKSSINDKNKFDVLIYYLLKCYNRCNKNLKNRKQLLKDLNLLQKINWQSLLTVDYLKDIDLSIDKYSVLVLIIKSIENKNIKIPLYDYILGKIELYLEKDLPTVHEILLSNVYGQIILDYEKTIISKIKDKYDKIKNSLLRPYCHCRNKKQWDLNICKLLFYTIALFIVNYTDYEKCTLLINTFVNVKNNIPHYLDKDINSIINQLKQQLPSK